MGGGVTGTGGGFSGGGGRRREGGRVRDCTQMPCCNTMGVPPFSFGQRRNVARQKGSQETMSSNPGYHSVGNKTARVGSEVENLGTTEVY